ncbi:MAG: hypothetical protein LBQ84_00445 [Flavobacteriaceae bacterium]|jgi:hypothetical protein|nr:hypothetical protein [Flavobacteriaceae bacterium]
MGNILSILLLLAFSLGYAQNKDLTCLDFTRGEFKNVSEISNLSSIIVRNGEKQLEVTDGIKNYKKIAWLNDCDYALFYPNKEAKRDEFKKFINKRGGIVVKMQKIEGKTFYYKTSYFDGKQEITSEGKLIKLSSKVSF